MNPEEIIKEQQIQLKEWEAELILLSLRQKIVDRWIDVSTSSDNFSLEDQAVLTIMRQGIKVNAISYFLSELPTQKLKPFLEYTIKLVSLILAEDISGIIGEIEKMTVGAAKNYVTDWLLQKQIKINEGNLKIGYPDCNGQAQEIVSPYIMVYWPISANMGNIGIGIYSSETVRTPLSTSIFQWEGGLEELPPFIVRINGTVIKQSNESYGWISGPEINIIFNEPVPQFDFKEPGFIEGIKQNIKNYFNDLGFILKIGGDKIKVFLEDTFNVSKDTSKDIYEKIKSILSEFDLFKAQVGPELTSPDNLGVDFSQINMENLLPWGEFPTEKDNSEGAPLSDVQQRPALDEMQEIIDDIAEKLDILTQEVAQLLKAQGKEIAENFEKDDEEELTEEDNAEESLASLAPQFYSKIIINEIQIAGKESAKEEFVELYNPNNEDVDLTGWYLQKKTKTAVSFSTFASSSLFSGRKIPGRGYFVIGRKETIFAALSDVVTDYSLGDDSTLIIKNPNREIVDKVGWGQANDFEALPSVNPPEGKSIGRRWSESLKEHIDTNNNRDDFSVLSPTPKRQNLEPTAETDTFPPTIIFNISPVQLSPSFSILWEILDNPTSEPGETTAAAGLDGFIFRWKKEGGDWQEDPYQKIEEALQAYSGQKQFSGEDGGIYYFQIKAKDKLGNESDWEEFSVEINAQPVVINEIAWMGTKASENDEWIELYNNTKRDINLDGWTIESEDGSPKIEIIQQDDANIIIPQGGYFLFERTDDNTVSDILADQIYTGAMGNSGEVLKLRDPDGNLIDEVGCLKKDGGSCEKWFAGKNDKKEEGWVRLSMEKINPELLGSDPASWASNNPEIKRNGLDAAEDFINGTPKSQNSVYQGQKSPEPPPPLLEHPWQMWGNNPQRTGQSQYIGPQTSNLSWQIDGIKGKESVAAGDGIIYVGAVDGLYAINPQDKTANLIYNQTGVEKLLISGDDTIYAISGSKLLAISADGTLKWEFILPIANVVPYFAIDKNNKLYHITYCDLSEISGGLDECVISFNPDGTVAWFYDIKTKITHQNPDFSLNPKGNIGGAYEHRLSSLTIAPDGVIYFVADNNLTALNPDGSLKWIKTIDYISSSIIVSADGSIFGFSYTRRICGAQRCSDYYQVFKIDSGGNEIWRSDEINTLRELLALDSDGVLYILQGGESFWANPLYFLLAFDTQTDRLLWAKEIPENPRSWESMKTSLAIGEDGVIYAGMGTSWWGVIEAIDSAGGSLKWEYNMLYHQPVSSLIIGSDGFLYAIANDKIFIFDSTGNQSPLAEAGGPYEAEIRETVVFDASGSSDPENNFLQYRWDFDNDGNWDTQYSTDPTANFSYSEPYSGVVKLEVYDGEFSAFDEAELTVYGEEELKDLGVDEENLENFKFLNIETEQNIDSEQSEQIETSTGGGLELLLDDPDNQEIGQDSVAGAEDSDNSASDEDPENFDTVNDSGGETIENGEGAEVEDGAQDSDNLESNNDDSEVYAGQTEGGPAGADSSSNEEPAGQKLVEEQIVGESVVQEPVEEQAIKEPAIQELINETPLDLPPESSSELPQETI